MGTRDNQIVAGDYVIHAGPGVYGDRKNGGAVFDYEYCRRAVKLVELLDDHIVIQQLYDGKEVILPRDVFRSWILATEAQIRASKAEAKAWRKNNFLPQVAADMEKTDSADSVEKNT